MYFIIMVDNLNLDSVRVVGYYKQRMIAKSVLVNNKVDLWETVYNYGVIAYIPEGVYPDQELYRAVYKYNQERNKYENIPFPEEWKNVWFGIG